MPALLERPKLSNAMARALHKHIMRERERKRQGAQIYCDLNPSPQRGHWPNWRGTSVQVTYLYSLVIGTANNPFRCKIMSSCFTSSNLVFNLLLVEKKITTAITNLNPVCHLQNIPQNNMQLFLPTQKYYYILFYVSCWCLSLHLLSWCFYLKRLAKTCIQPGGYNPKIASTWT